MATISKNLISKRTQRYSIAGLKKYIVDTKVGYEHLTGPVIPYYEFDNEYKTKEEQEEHKETDFKKGYDAVTSMYDPDVCNVKILSACGFDPVKEVYKNSYHFRIRLYRS